MSESFDQAKHIKRSKSARAQKAYILRANYVYSVEGLDQGAYTE